jgi:hypothetical protein
MCRLRLLSAPVAACTVILAAPRRGGAAEVDAALREALGRRLDFSYSETPIEEALSDVRERSGAEVVLDRRAALLVGDQALTWSARGSTVERALRWITRLADLEYVLVDGAVLVTTPERAKGEVELRVYNVRDLSSRIEPGSPGPPVPFSPSEVATEPREVTLAECIMTRIRPGTWAPELGTSIDERDGLLIVVQRPDVHAMIGDLLAALRANRARAVTVRVLVVRADAGATVPPEPGNADAQGFPAGLPEDAVLAGARLDTLEGRTAHAVWGRKTHYVASKHLEWPEAEADYPGPQHVDYEVVPPGGEEGAPRALVVKVPSPRPSAPPGEGVLVPDVDALLDGVLVEVTPRLVDEGAHAELALRVVASRIIEAPSAGGGDAVSTPTCDYSRVAETCLVPLGPWCAVARSAVREGTRRAPVDVYVRLTAAGRAAGGGPGRRPKAWRGLGGTNGTGHRGDRGHR